MAEGTQLLSGSINRMLLFHRPSVDIVLLFVSLM